MEQQSQSFELDENICKWGNGLKRCEELANLLEMECEVLDMDLKAKNSFYKDLEENFNIDRDDFGIYHNIQRDKDTEAYIRQLHLTLELIMQKYRNLSQKHIQETKVNLTKFSFACKCKEKLEEQHNTISSLILMMETFFKEGRCATDQLLSENARLKAENDTYRQILELPIVQHEKEQEEDEEDDTGNTTNTTVQSMEI